ncbi:19161_t:CDS:2 [Dentiscutata erythropus]|uniref:19161_t:CDS:1 n=1 Tax=Dentiscutata erythropus TaxID=1348616 RepID=A0A9N8V728_9GLOM|nr:19161_t:CDS:2 [Dentiscutata erythropus]
MPVDTNQVLNFLFQLLVAIQLIAVAILYANVLPFPDPPLQKISNVTGLPIWVPASASFTSISEFVGLTEYVAAFITGVLSVYCVYIKLHKIPPVDSSSVDVRGGHEHTEEIIWTKLLFNTIVTGYVIVTFIARITSTLFQMGKLWASFGIYHNLLELCLAAALLQKGTSNYVMGLIIIAVYSISVIAITSQINWYWDAVFFKFQGKFSLGLFATGRNSVNASSLTPQYQIYCLVAAATIHLIGNIAIVDDNIQRVIFYRFFNVHHLCAAS